MERETVKLLNVVKRIARAAGYAAWTKAGADATQFCASQYNRILARLSELEPAIKPLFAPLNDSASPDVIRIAARDLLAYFEADDPEYVHFSRGFDLRGCGPRRARIRCAPFSVTCE
jgi:hypothetical protein